ncbi:bifunctional nuclease family protein [Phycisphaerales bacterium AB-hyl4]|uniref:Bifunctional nuclease family protein n=1 Tax=Natronomicrosphaera hydrolytica TaxID=3242702 RepID=A0ABV4U6E3_9BACT
MAVRVELARILIRETDDTHIVELREVDGERTFPIVIGLTEAAAINRRLMGETPPRPQTHELLANIIEQLGYRLDRVVINDLRNHTFYARLMLEKDGENVDIDSRPSDAIAIGVATDVPIYVEEHVLDEVSRAD